MRLRETDLQFVDDSSAAVLPSPDEAEVESSGISEAFAVASHAKHDDSVLSSSGGQSSPPRSGFIFGHLAGDPHHNVKRCH